VPDHEADEHATVSARDSGSPAPLSLTAWLRYDAVMRLLPSEVGKVLEIGAGLGSVGALLARRFEYVGLEPDPVSYGIAVRRIGPAGRVLNLAAEDFEPAESFDVVCAFEVLEHCEDDRAVLASWLQHLRPRGYAIISVPFGRDRFGRWDERAGHYRRYDRADLVETMQGAGLEAVESIAYGFPLGSATALARNALERHERHDSLERRTAASARGLQPPSWASWATRLLSAPFRVLQRPFSGTNLGPGIVARGRLPARG
jgi:SAM-dependent methyltransferase